MTDDDGRSPTRRTTVHHASAPIARANVWSSPAPRMRGVSHRHVDHDSRAWDWFARGPIVAADGGERGAAPRTRSDEPRESDGREPSEARRGTPDATRNVETEQLRHVSHAPADGEGANQVWNRGHDAAAAESTPGGEADEDAV